MSHNVRCGLWFKVADVEGISLYQGANIHGKKQELLVVSSQGNNSYLLYQAEAPYAQVGRFRIGVNLNGMANGAAQKALSESVEKAFVLWMKGLKA